MCHFKMRKILSKELLTSFFKGDYSKFSFIIVDVMSQSPLATSSKS